MRQSEQNTLRNSKVFKVSSSLEHTQASSSTLVTELLLKIRLLLLQISRH